jgi:Rne/Rng family ribonuclease
MAETKDKIKRQLIINYVPGEECRVAVVNNGRLDEFFSEKRDSVSHVGNIYVGRVTNVEPSIQAAFIDFGLPQGGFLHVSDVHPTTSPATTAKKAPPNASAKKHHAETAHPSKTASNAARKSSSKSSKRASAAKAPP